MDRPRIWFRWAHRLDGASQIALLEGGQDRGVLAYRDEIGVVGPRVTS